VTRASENEFPQVIFVEGSAPGTPPTGFVYAYAKADGLLYSKDDAGTETLMSGGAGGGGGAPTDAKYVTTAVDATLSAEIVIPGLAASADIRVAGANDQEFDAALSGNTALGTPDTANANSDALSHLHLVQNATSSGIYVGEYWATPGTPFTVSAKISDAYLRANSNAVAIMVGEGTPGAFVVLSIEVATQLSLRAQRWTNNTTFGATIGTNLVVQNFQPPYYVRIVVNSTTDLDFHYSQNGLVWMSHTEAYNPSLTVGSMGLVVKSQNATYPGEAMFDWLRVT
jgi:hypothetical protein